MGLSDLTLAGGNDGLGAVTGGGVGEGFFPALAREARGGGPLDAELGHHGEGATVGRAATKGATDVELAVVDVPQVERQPAALGVHAYELHMSRGSREPDRLGHQ